MKYSAYPVYKASGVQWLGDVPAHWTLKAIKWETSVQRGASPRPIDDPNYFDDEGRYAWVRISDVTAAGMYLDSTEQRLSDIGSSLSVKMQPGTLFLSIAGTVGKPCITKIKCCIHDGFVYFPRWKGDSRYLFYIFASGEPYKGLGKMGTQLNLNTDTVGSIVIGLPHPQEQTAIANVLDRETGRIDTLVGKKRRLVALLKEQRTALISRTVTRGLPEAAAHEFGLKPHTHFKDSGIEWLGEVPEMWQIPPLYARYSVELGKMLNESRITGNHLVRYLRNVDIQWDSINFADLPEMDISEIEYQRYTVQKGDLLVCEGGEVGRAAIVDEISSLTGYQKALHRMRAIKPTEVARFMFYTLFWAANTGMFNAGGTSTIAHLTGEQLRKYRFPTPPFFEQTAIATYLDRETTKIDQLVAKVEAAIARLQEYRTVLITAAVTGKIDVRDIIKESAA